MPPHSRNLRGFQAVGRVAHPVESAALAGGGGGVRTHETLSGLTVFKTSGVNRFPTPPFSMACSIVTYAARDDNPWQASNAATLALTRRTPDETCASCSENPPFTRAARMIRFQCNYSQSLAARSLGQPAREGSAMLRRNLILAVAASVALAGFVGAPLRAQNSSAQQSQPAAAPYPAPAPNPAAKFLKTEVPAYHAEPPKGALPDTLDPAQ